jgi:Mrp family chromosome partitioning ATPase
VQELAKVDGNTNLEATTHHESKISRQVHASPFVKLTGSLFFRESAPRVIVLVSCKSQEGVSTTSRSFKEFLMGVGARVVLLQAAECLTWPNARHSTSSGNFGLTSSPSELFFAARKSSDVLLIDCPSLETSPAVFMLASHVDGIVLVVEDGRHSAKEMQRAIKLIKDANGIVLGVILNNRRRSLPSWLYTLFSRIKR